MNNQNINNNSKYFTNGEFIPEINDTELGKRVRCIEKVEFYKKTKNTMKLIKRRYIIITLVALVFAILFFAIQIEGNQPNDNFALFGILALIGGIITLYRMNKDMKIYKDQIARIQHKKIICQSCGKEIFLIQGAMIFSCKHCKAIDTQILYDGLSKEAYKNKMQEYKQAIESGNLKVQCCSCNKEKSLNAANCFCVCPSCGAENGFEIPPIID